MYMHKAYYFTISQVWDYLEPSITENVMTMLSVYFYLRFKLGHHMIIKLDRLDVLSSSLMSLVSIL